MYRLISGLNVRRTSGLTLLELLTALAVAAILLTVAVPNIGNTVKNSRRTAAVNDLIASIQLARTNAIRRSQQLVICPDDGLQSCRDDGDWRSGWLVFVNTDFDRPPRLNDNDIVVYRHGPVAQLKIASNRSYYAFHRIGLRSTNGTLIVCDDRGPEQARAVIISYTGRPRVARQQADGTPLECV